jgi:predicted AAA+ superfamily ATPase
MTICRRRVAARSTPREAIEEKVSLSERFGLWLSFHAFDQDDYLAIAGRWLQQLGWQGQAEDWQAEALRWAWHAAQRAGGGTVRARLLWPARLTHVPPWTSSAG